LDIITECKSFEGQFSCIGQAQIFKERIFFGSTIWETMPTHC